MSDQHDHDHGAASEHSQPRTQAHQQPAEAEHGHGFGHDHDHKSRQHDQEQESDHDHAPVSGSFAWLREILPFGHGHTHAEANIDSALEGSEQGIRALKLSLAILGFTALLQLGVVVISGSVGLLADTIHNVADAMTAVPLWVAFALSRRPANRHYTYGYGRAEDVAGLFIVLVIALSAGLAAYESLDRLFNPQPVSNLWWVAAAALIGFLGNEAVALLRIRVGREIGSAALVADGMHARADGITSLAVLGGVIGVALGFPQADPLIGLLITIAIIFILKDTAVTMWRRLMDAVDPEIVGQIEHTATHVAQVRDVHNVQVRWLGHKLHAELHITVPGSLSVSIAHDLVEEIRHTLFHHLPRLSEIIVHVDPDDRSNAELDNLTAHHQQAQVGSAVANTQPNLSGHSHKVSLA